MKLLALCDHETNDTNYLSFKRGDIFILISKDDTSIPCYKAVNVITDEQGLIATEKMFEFGRTLQKCVAVVDYKSQNPKDDELSLTAGETITIIDNSNTDLWKGT